MVSRIVTVAVLAIIALNTVEAANRINVNFANILADADIPLPSSDEQTVVLPDPSTDGVAVNFAYMMNGVTCTRKESVCCSTENAYNFTSIKLDPYVATMPGLCRWSAEPGRRAACVRPKGTLDVSIEVTNNGVGKWNREEVTLQLEGQDSFTYPYWKAATLYLSEDVSVGETATFRGILQAPSTPGVYSLSWQGVGPCGRFGNITGTVEVTCSDGIYCNGMERYVNGECVSSAYEQCNDFSDCTTDICDEENQTCSHEIVPGKGCNRCDPGKPCTPNCKDGQQCGFDGCGGFCGLGADCGVGQACTLEGMCIVPSSEGSCENPIPLMEGGIPSVGRITMLIDNSVGVDEVTPTCNDESTATELIYYFDLPQGVTLGIDARMYNTSEERDTLLEIRYASCQDKTDADTPWVQTGNGQNVWCSDDASPPGHTGSRIATLLTQPGRYYLVADGYSSQTVGWSTLDVTFTPAYVPSCLSRYCGDDGNGGVCGYCGEDEVCSERFQCIPAECNSETRCELSNEFGNVTWTKECGFDNCQRGGRCGEPSMNGGCAEGLFCREDIGKCMEMPVCNHLVPTCSELCSETQFCGVDCQCHERSDRWPDIIIDGAKLFESVLFDQQTFDNTTCALVEKCIDDVGERRLMKFGVAVANVGNYPLIMAEPKTRPDEFFFATCHNHYHYNNFANYRLLDANSQTVRRGHKQAYCLEDSTQFDGQVGPDIPCTAQTDCNSPGLSQGWFDIYGNDLDCQWIDITGVEPGVYTLRVDINTARQMQESTYENNSAEIQVTIGATNDPSESYAGTTPPNQAPVA